jgi:hypothetical protein
MGRGRRGQYLDASGGSQNVRRCDVDLIKRLLQVRRSKNETSHRIIPLNASAIEAVALMLERADLLGHTEAGHYL